MSEEKKIKKDAQWVMARTSRSHGLLPVQKVLKKYGDPQDQLKIIHVAGTNGKGSTVNYLKDILMAKGYRVGTFTSPHLEEHYDRIRIDDVWISEERFDAYVEEIADDIEAYDLGMFEIDLIIALRWFEEEGVDYAVIECGIGGRLDNTNIIKSPLVSVITTIGFDHMSLLGERLSQIAFEKAGIIKPYCSCAIGFLDPEAEEVIRMQAYRKHAKISSPASHYRETGRDTFVYRGQEYRIRGGRYQKHNAALALHTAWLLGIDIEDQKVIEAVLDSQWKGRFETVSEKPLIILDGAHNEEGVRALCDSIGDLPHPLRIVFSALKDKPGRHMAEMLKERCDLLYITSFSFYRADTLEDLEVSGAFLYEDWKEAVDSAVSYDEGGCTVITGSLYFISEVRKYLLK